MPRSLGIDIGTNRADFLLADLETGHAHSIKHPITEGGLSQTVSSGVSRLLGQSGIEGDKVDRVVVALPEEVADASSTRVGLLVTGGFEQSLARIGGKDQGWYTRGVPERVSASGNTLLQLDEDAAHHSISELMALRVDAIAVCLLHGHRNPSHELRLGALVQDHGVDIPVVLSHEVAPTDGEEARTRAVLMAARAIRPVERHLAAVAEGLAEAKVGVEAEVLQSTGDRTSADAAMSASAPIFAARKAGAHAAAAHIAARAGFPDALSMELGGSDAVGAIIRRGSARVSGETMVQDGLTGLPSLDARRIGAGIDAVATVPLPGTVRVGPDHARPACTGGNGQPTVMDALAAMRRLPVERMSLDPDAAEKAVSGLAGSMGVDLHRAATGVVSQHAGTIAGALRRIAVEKGLDAADLALVASGGAGPVLACEVARAAGVSTVVVPQNAAALSAERCAAAGKSAQFAAAPGGQGADDLAEAMAVVRNKAAQFVSESGGAGHIAVRADLRVPGANFETSLPVDIDIDVAEHLRHRTSDAFSKRFGHAPQREPVISTVRAIVTVGEARDRTEAAQSGSDPGLSVLERVQAWFDDGFSSTPVIDGSSLVRGSEVAGPALVLLAGTTVVINPGWSGELDKERNIILSAGHREHDRKGQR